MRFEYKIENIGYTRNKNLAVATLSENAVKNFNELAQKEGMLPVNVIGLKRAYFSPDEEEAGEWKYFASVTLLVEAVSEKDAEALNVPDDFLDIIAELVANTEPSVPFSLDENWEILEVRPGEP